MKTLPKHADTKFQRYWFSLDAQERCVFADKIGYSVARIKSAFIRPLIRPLHEDDLTRPTACRPKRTLMKLMARSAGYRISYKDMYNHFYPYDEFQP